MKRALLAGLLALLSGCGSTASTTQAPTQLVFLSPSPGATGTPGATARAGSPAGGAPAQPSRSSGAPAAGGGGGSGGGGGAGGGAASPQQNPDWGKPGTLARAMLKPAPYTQIALEIDSTPDAAPTAGELNTLRGVIAKATGKTPGVAPSRSLTGRGSGGCWTSQDLVNLATTGRNANTSGSTVGLDFIFVDGAYSADGRTCSSSTVLGAAYLASTVVIFTQQVDNLATPTVGAAAFMQSVTTHEFGHLCALVNLNGVYQSHYPHEDPQHPGHSNDRNSVMYYAIDQSNLVQQFVSGPPVNFDQYDQADLQGLANGTL